LRIAETKSILQKIARDCRNIALPPTPVIDVRLINENQSRCHRENQYDDHKRGGSTCNHRPVGGAARAC